MAQITTQESLDGARVIWTSEGADEFTTFSTFGYYFRVLLQQ